MRIGAWTRGALLLLALVFAFSALRYRIIGTDGQAWRNAINGDGHGYHGLLVGLFLRGNPANAPINPAFFTPAGNGHVIQYTAGASLMQAPFFLVARAVASVRGTDDDKCLGIEHQIGVVLAAMSWSMLALWLLALTLLRAGITDRIVAYVLLLLGLGSGLIHYAVIAPALAHAYGFAAVSWCLFEAQRAWQGRSGAWPRLAVALALAVLVRPTLGILAFALPVVALTDEGRFAEAIRPKKIALAALAGLGLLGVQSLLWKLQCGAWLADGYAGEGFRWWQPRIWSVLFGARKGLFFYWPALLLMLPALAWALARKPRAALPVAIGFAALVYVTSAWWNWYYGHGYGMRPLLDALPVAGVLIGGWMHALAARMRTVLMAIASPLIALQLFHAWQYEAGILHPFNMDKEKYALVFLRGDEEARNRFGDANVAELFAPNGMDTLAVAALSGDSVNHLSGAWPYTPALRIKGDRLPPDHELFANIELHRKAFDQLASDTVLLVFTYATEGEQRMHVTFPMNDIRRMDDRHWRHWRYAFNMPKAEPREEVAIYLWQPGRGRVLVKNFRLTVRAVRD
jgi:hypothetical protein